MASCWLTWLSHLRTLPIGRLPLCLFSAVKCLVYWQIILLLWKTILPETRFNLGVLKKRFWAKGSQWLMNSFRLCLQPRVGWYVCVHLVPFPPPLKPHQRAKCLNNRNGCGSFNILVFRACTLFISENLHTLLCVQLMRFSPLCPFAAGVEGSCDEVGLQRSGVLPLSYAAHPTLGMQGRRHSAVR